MRTELKKLRKIKLKAKEKSAIRDFLHVRIADDVRHISYNPFIYFNLSNHRTMLATIIAAILLLTGGGTSMAAEMSVPGDFLYPIKTEVNERVIEVFKRNEEKRADWSARQAERRLEEANHLLEDGQLTPANSAFLAEKFRQHVDKTNELVEKLEEKGNIQAAAKISAHLKYMLSEHFDDNEDDDNSTTTSTVNTTITASTTTSTGNMYGKLNWGRIKKEIRTQFTSSTVWEEHLKDRISTSTIKDSFKADAAAGVKNAAENRLVEIKKYYESKKGELDADAKTDIEAKLKNAEDVKADADQKLSEKKYAEAFILYHRSMELAQQTKSLIHRYLAQERRDDRITATSTPRLLDDNNDDDEEDGDEDEDDEEDDDRGQKDEDKDNNGRGNGR